MKGAYLFLAFFAYSLSSDPVRLSCLLRCLRSHLLLYFLTMIKYLQPLRGEGGGVENEWGGGGVGGYTQSIGKKGGSPQGED